MRKPNPPKLVTVALTTTITIVFWIFFTLYKVLTTAPEPSVSDKLLEPILPQLDTESLGKINDRIFFDEGSFNFAPPQNTPVLEPPISEIEETPTPIVASDEGNTVP